jgi:hypothetical protein
MDGKRKLIFISVLLGGAFTIGGYFVPEGYWQSLLIELGATFLAVAVGIVAVNIYLDKDSRKAAIKSIVQLSGSSMNAYHRHITNLLLTRFDADEATTIVRKYAEHNGDINFIKPDHRRWIYDLAKADQARIAAVVNDLERTLEEVTSLVGWDLDSSLLASTLHARQSIRLYREIPFDDSEEAMKRITEHLLDIDIYITGAASRFIALADLSSA